MPSSSNASSRKPRLLIILNRFVIGGQAVDTIPLAWHLQNAFEILILYGEKEKDEVEPVYLLQKYSGLKTKKVKSLRRSINPFKDVVAFFSVLFIIKSFRADIVHTHGAKSGFVGRLAAWLLSVPVIVHTFHGHFFHSYFSRKTSRFIAGIERAMGHITTSAVALSETQKKELVEEFRIMPAHKVTVIPLGFSFDEQNNAENLRTQFRNKYGLTDNDVAIGIVGRIVPVKNHSFFVRVIQKILSYSAHTSAAFFIIGDGELREKIEEQLRRRSISYSDHAVDRINKVVFTSWLTNMYEVMNGLDIVALTSLNEGTPLSIIEAEFFKKPVISTDAGGVKDTMQDEVTGYVIPQQNVELFSQKLLTLIEDGVARHSMGEAGYEFASKKFSKEKEINSTTAFYNMLLFERNSKHQEWKK